MEDQNLLDKSQNDELNQPQSSGQEQPKQPKEKKQSNVEKLDTEPNTKAEPVNEAEYNEYTSLKFLELSGTKLKDETTARIKELEAKLKSCAGSRPVRTVRAAIKNEQVLLVEGVPVPASILAIITNSGTTKYYLGE